MNIVLAHGILGFKKIGKIAYFNGIKDYLEKRHRIKVLVTEVSPTGSVAERGAQLGQQIRDELGNSASPVLNPNEPTHIIAHSMGGLDSRYILSPKNENNIADVITSLTTIGTPHRGSPIADLLYPILDGKSRFSFLELWERKTQDFLDYFGISSEGLRDLTTKVLTEFDRETVDSDQVHYFWTGGVGRSGSGSRTSFPFLATYQYLYRTGRTEEERKNDGVVTLASARHGEQIGRDWLADHADEVGHDLNNPLMIRTRAFAYLDAYDEIIARISPLTKTGPIVKKPS